VLKNYSLAAIKAAIYSYIHHESDGRFMPKPADIIRHLCNDKKQRALDAWSQVESAIRHIGRYSSVAFEDHVIHVVIQKMGGWVKLCSHKVCQMPALANTFVKAYTACLEQLPQAIPDFISGLLGEGEIVKISQFPTFAAAQWDPPRRA
jgi:hypothetical protein